MADETTRARQWRGRPALAWATRVAIFVVPFLAAMAVAFVLSSHLPVASSLPAQIVRWLAIVAVSTVAMMGVDRIARRLLPLSVLLKLTLVFPDHAPSRFAVAMRTGTTAQLRKRLEAAREVPFGETQQEAAERLLELVGLLSHHDRLTRGHSERVRAYSHLIGEEMGLTDSEMDKLRWSALLHDVGKVAIDTDILNKPSSLTDEEYEAIKTHPDEGRVLVAPLAPWLGDSIQAVWQHHERFDGGGYPQGLAGTDISFAARVVTVADCYDVMTSARSYKKPMSAEAARAELAACSGSQFDPIVVRAFLNVSLGRLRLMAGPLAWFAQLALLEPAGVVHAGATTAPSGGSAAASGSTGVVGGAGSAASSGASTVTAMAATGGSAGAASTVAATAAGVLASTVGMATASPAVFSPVASASAPITAVAFDDREDLGAPQDTIVMIDSDLTLPAAADDEDAFPGVEASTATDDGSRIETSALSDSPATTTDAESESTASPSTTIAPPLPTSGSPEATTTTTVVATSPTTTTRAESTTTVAPSATTTPTTTTTTIPTATTSTTTTTIPASTTTTTTTTTTAVPGNDSPPERFLGSDASNMAAPAFHGSTSAAPPDVALPNYDTDRDSAPGALVQKDAAGIDGTDPTKLLTFRVQPGYAFVIDHDLHVELYIAAKDFERKDIDVEVGLYHCTAPGQCTLLGSDDDEVENATNWKKRKFHFHDTEATVGAGDWIEIRVAVLDGSQDDGWFAFGTDRFDAKITARDDD